MDTDPHNEAPAAAAPEPEPETNPTEAPQGRAERSGVSRGLLIGAVVGILAMLAMQVFTIISANRTNDRIGAIDDQIAAIDGRIDDVATEVSEVRKSVSDVDLKVDGIAAAAALAAAGSGSSSPTAPSVPAGSLPRFEQGQPDAALGVPLGNVTGPEYYTETDLTVDPADGTPRAWLVWAHWCPFCQQELPLVSEWHIENADRFPNVELLSVTTAIDPGRENPLEPYLDDLQLSFPAVVDVDGSLSAQFGVSAFPFWVFTAPDGATLLRVTGALEIEQIEEIFGQLDALAL